MKKSLIPKIILAVILLLLFGKKDVKASTILFEDDFESGNFDKWQDVRDNPYPWTIVDGKAQAYVEDGGTVVELVPKDSFWDQSWKNIEYSFDYVTTAGTDKNVSFKYEDLNNWYEIHFQNQGFEVIRILDGFSAFSYTEPYVLTPNVSHHFVITLNEQHVKIVVDDVVISEFDDPTYNGNGGKIGMKAGTGSDTPTIITYDNILVKNLDPDPTPTPTPTPTPVTTLNVPYFSQLDPVWKNKEYDHLSRYNWAISPTMGSYGCATTSMAMIMNFHGLTQMPNGTPVTPDTLNTWLRQQKDGYLNEGLINWNAVTRLTRQIAQQYPGKPKLEFLWKAGNLTNFQTEIDAERPAIIQVPNHFVVGTGINSDTVMINDPLSVSNATLASYDNQLQSLRTFTPAHSDLSYITVVTQPDVHVTITGNNGSILPTQDYIDGGISDDQNGGHTQPLTHIIQLEKPENGNYRINVSRTESGPYKIDVFAYDQLANVTTESRRGIVQATESALDVRFSKNGKTKFSRKKISWNECWDHIQHLFKHKKIKQRSLFYYLQLNYLIGSSNHNTMLRRHVSNVLRNTIQHSSEKELSDDAKELLLEDVENLE